MDPVKMKELKNYLKPALGWTIFGGVVFVVGLAVIPLIGFASLIYLLFGAFLLWIGISGANDVNKLLKDFESKGELERVLADFESAKPFVKGKLRAGRYYLFGKRKGTVVPYGEIRQLWQTVRRRNGVESSRTLQFIDSKGSTRTLCDLQLRKKSDDELLQIMMIVKSSNPGVKLGYK